MDVYQEALEFHRAVTLAGLLNALRVVGKQPDQVGVVVKGRLSLDRRG